MREVQFIAPLHTSSKRDYLARMNAEKPENMRVAKQWGYEYWDGDRKYGYGGMKYDGRYRDVADKLIDYYHLQKNAKILDIGCGKGFLLYDIANKLNSLNCWGTDISEYAIESIPSELKLTTVVQDCAYLGHYSSMNNFDFTYSINTFHNLEYKKLKSAIKEMIRVGKPESPRYICVESYRNEEELTNLQCWALTCLSFYSPDDWKNILSDNGYDGDVEFIYFE